MDLKQPRPPRYPLQATVFITDQLASESINGQTSDVSLAGCYVETTHPPNIKSTVRVQLSHAGTTVTAHGDVVRIDPNKGMGVRFRAIAPDQLAVLKKWLFAVERPD
jgi:hypothetical protein